MYPRLRRLSRAFSTAAETLTPKPPPQTLNPGPVLNRKDLAGAINALFDEPDLDRLVSSFKDFSRTHRFRARHRVYDSAVSRLAAAGRHSCVRDILDFQKQFRVELGKEGFGVRLITLYGKADMPDDAERTFAELPELGSPRTAKSFNALLTVFVDCRRFQKVVDAIERPPESITPDAISYNILAKALCAKGDLDAGLKVLDTMEEKGFSPSLITYNTLLNTLYKNDHFSNAQVIWERMINAKIEPDIMSFNVRMRGPVSKGNMSQAVELFNELERLKIKPDIFTFNNLITGYCNEGNVEEAKKVYENLAENGVASNRKTLGLLLPKLTEVGDLDMALKVCSDNICHRQLVEKAHLQEVVNGFVKASRVEEAKQLVNLARKNDYSIKILKMP